jgi:hypothetical protein
MRERLGAFLSIVFFAVTALAQESRSFVIGTSAVRITADSVAVNEAVLSEDTFLITINGKTYRPVVDREIVPGREVIRFVLPGARTSSTVTRLGDRTAMTLVTGETSYRVRPSWDDASAFVLETTSTRVASKLLDLEGDTMTPFEAAVRSGNFTSLEVQPLAVPPSTRRRAVAPGEQVVHQHIAIYTARFAAHYGSVDNIRLAIQHLLDVRDTALHDSAVYGIRDVLVYTEELNDPTWLATADTSDILTSFSFDAHVRDLRVRYQANAGYWDDNPSSNPSRAVLFEGTPTAMCGNYIIQWHQAGLERSVAHEIGHVGGADHNKANASGDACPYCFGWYNAYIRDIMAVACGDMDCHDVALYSNLQVAFKADFWDYQATVVLGSSEENVARRLSETRYDVRDFWKLIPNH